MNRFFSRVNKTDSCWLWLGAKQSRGYGHFSLDGKTTLAHRYSWEQVNGPIPQGLVIDHLCRVRSCVNPEHLRIVTQSENSRVGISPPAINGRKSRCGNGHPFDVIKYDGKRSCSVCVNASFRARYRRNKNRAELASLREAAGKLAEALEICEFGDYNQFIHESVCPNCGKPRSEGHVHDCEVALALALPSVKALLEEKQ